MDGYVLVAAAQGYQLTRIDGLRGTIVAYFVDDGLGERVAALLNREGMVDVPAAPLERAVEL